VAAGSQPALPRHDEAVGEDSQPGCCNRLKSQRRRAAAPLRSPTIRYSLFAIRYSPFRSARRSPLATRHSP
jgi:hypothetical protein